MGKRLPQLYYMKMKISHDLGFITISHHGNVMTASRVFYLSLCFSVPGAFFKKSLKGCNYAGTAIIASIMAKFEQIL